MTKTNTKVHTSLSTRQGYHLPSLDTLTHKLSKIPRDVFTVHGCLSCSWRNTIECPYYDTVNHVTQYPKSGICDRRKVWLLVITPDYDKVVTLSQWKRDFMLTLGSMRLEGELKILRDLENELQKLPPYSDDHELRKKINTIDNRIAMRKKDINMLWGKILQYTDSQIDRETPKQVEVKKMTIRPSDVADMLRDNIIDIEDDSRD